MGKIQQLPEEVAIKIAAGEVVERPSSVVKELVENAIDAAATKIEIALENGGKTFISIRDNGSGMDREDAQKAFLRHGTSKVRSVDDLMQVATLGFRGEALAAIAASSDVELITALSHGDQGTQVMARNAEVITVKPHAPIPGTTVSVKELFSSIPARQKFLKSDGTEWKATLETITKQMMAHPEIGFVITHNRRTVYSLPANQTFVERVATIWKIDETKLLPVLAESPHLNIKGVIASPQVSHETKGRQFLSVNDHPIQDKALARAIKDAYGTMLPPGTQPVYALTVSIHPGMVDVNIHPRKDEVRFINPQEVFRFLLVAVSQTLGRHNVAFQSIGIGDDRQKTPLSPGSAYTTGKNLKEEKIEIGDRGDSFKVERLVGRDLSTANSQKQLGDRGVKKNPSGLSPVSDELPGMNLYEQFDPQADADRTAQWGIPAQKIDSNSSSPLTLTLDNCFLVSIYDDTLYLVDQHAAHERILYHQLWEQEKDKEVQTQSLLIPIELILNESDRARLEEQLEVFTNIGFSFQLDEENIFLTGVPHLLKQIKPSQFFHDVLHGIKEERPEPELTTFKHKLFATMACKAAVKAGDILDDSQKQRLMADLFVLPDRFTCPHGRPSYIVFTPEDLEKIFKRTGF